MLSFLRINRNIRSLKRYRDIIGILIKYGFGHVIEQLNIDYYLEVGRRIVTLGIAHKSIARLSAAERLRLAMTELGPTFVKLGQILSTRPDVIPREYVDELKKLQDRVPPVPIAEIEDEVVRIGGKSLEELFAWINPEPLAAASIAQVHRVRLHSGEDAVLKVRRPGIRGVIETDLDILEGLAYLIERHLPGFDIYDPSGLVREFRRSIHRELDFTREGHTVERFARNFAGNSRVYVPAVYWEQTNDGYLTLEYIDGIKISDVGALQEAGHDLKGLARTGADAFLDQVLEHQLFHGDPHPGNVFVRKDGSICLVDYGMVGRVDEGLKRQLVDILFAILERDVERIVSHLFYAGSIPEGINTNHLKRDLGEFIDHYYGYPLQDMRVGRMLLEFIDILSEYRIRFPADFMLLAKALVIMEGVGRQLDPEFNMISHLKPYMGRIARERLSPSGISREAFDIAGDYAALMRTLPRDLKEFINRVNQNKFKIELEHGGINNLISDIDKSSNRLSFSLIIASLIIGSSIIMHTEKGPFLLGFPLLGIIGYTGAGLLGLWLAIAILRSGRL